MRSFVPFYDVYQSIYSYKPPVNANNKHNKQLPQSPSPHHFDHRLAGSSLSPRVALPLHRPTSWLAGCQASPASNLRSTALSASPTQPTTNTAHPLYTRLRNRHHPGSAPLLSTPAANTDHSITSQTLVSEVNRQHDDHGACPSSTRHTRLHHPRSASYPMHQGPYH